MELQHIYNHTIYRAAWCGRHAMAFPVRILVTLMTIHSNWNFSRGYLLYLVHCSFLLLVSFIEWACESHIGCHCCQWCHTGFVTDTIKLKKLCPCKVLARRNDYYNKECVFSVRHELRLTKELVMMRILQHSIIRWQHSDRWNLHLLWE